MVLLWFASADLALPLWSVSVESVKSCLSKTRNLSSRLIYNLASDISLPGREPKLSRSFIFASSDKQTKTKLERENLLIFMNKSAPMSWWWINTPIQGAFCYLFCDSDQLCLASLNHWFGQTSKPSLLRSVPYSKHLLAASTLRPEAGGRVYTCTLLAISKMLLLSQIHLMTRDRCGS